MSTSIPREPASSIGFYWIEVLDRIQQKTPELFKKKEKKKRENDHFFFSPRNTHIFCVSACSCVTRREVHFLTLFASGHVLNQHAY